MDILIHSAASRFAVPQPRRRRFRTSFRQCIFSMSFTLPFTEREAKYHGHLRAAVDVVERACHLCVDVQKSLVSTNGKIVERIDQTPVTVADFGVQALVSLAVTDKSSGSSKQLSEDDVLTAIDRGGKDAYLFGSAPATYWILDPIDGTRGFVQGSEALYVGDRNSVSRSGIIMISHVGCGTWRTRLWDQQSSNPKIACDWTRCLVDRFHQVHEAHFCIPNSQTWESLPLSTQFSATTLASSVGEKQILLLPTCCGSLCKYLVVASGRASIFILRARTNTVIKVWDHAVGIICINEAGGKVTDWKGSELDFAADQRGRRVLFPSSGVLVTNNSLHNQILDIIASS